MREPPWPAATRSSKIGQARGIALPALSAATTAAAAAAITTAAAAALFARPRFVDRQIPAVVLFFVQTADRFLRCVVVRHLHKPKTLAAAGVAILHDLRALHRAELSKQLFQILACHIEAQIPDIKSLTHNNRS